MGYRIKLPKRVFQIAPLTATALMATGGVLFAEDVPDTLPIQDLILRDGQRFAARFMAIYERTPWTDRVAWGALAGCIVLAVFTIFERLWSLRRKKIMPRRFLDRIEERLEDGRLDRAKLIDLCEMNPCAAARVTSSLASRWGRSSQDLERALTHSVRVETEELSRNIPTLRRVAILAPLLGLLGSLLIVGRLLQAEDAKAVEESWTALVAQGLLPLTGGVLISVLSLISYDGLSIRVTKYKSRLESLGARLLDQISLATVSSDPPRMLEAPVLPRPHMHEVPPRREKSRDFESTYDEQPPRRRASGSRRRKPIEPIDLDEFDD